MKKLFIEELESRNLLNAGGFGHQAMPWVSPDRIDTPGMMHSDNSFANFGNRDRFDRDPSASPPNMEFEETITIVFLVPEASSGSLSANLSTAAPDSILEPTVGPAIFPLAPAPGQAAARPFSESAFNFEPVSDSNFQAEAISLQRNVGNLTEAAIASTLENGPSANASAVANVLSAKTSSPLLARADILASTGNLRGVSSGLGAENVRAARDTTDPDLDVPMIRSEPLQPVPQPSISSLAPVLVPKLMSAGIAALPQFSDLMNSVAVADLAGIEQGISSFLQHLDGTQSGAVPSATRDLYPWLLAGVATAAACEMARRQMRKTPKALDMVALQMAPWEAPHERENG